MRSKVFLVIFITIFLVQNAGAVTPKSIDSAKIIFELKPKEIAIFFYYDKNYTEKTLSFNNNTTATVRRVQMVEIDKPLEITYKSINQSSNGLDRVYKHFYIINNDSVVFSFDHGVPKLLSAESRNLFIEEAVDLTDVFISKKLTFDSHQELTEYLKKLETEYQQNILLPTVFFEKKAISSQVRDCWKTAIECDYYLKYFSCVNKNLKHQGFIKDSIDRMFKVIIQRMNHLQQMRYGGMAQLASSMIFHVNETDNKVNFNKGAAFALQNLKEIALPTLFVQMRSIPEIGNRRYSEGITNIKEYIEKNNPSQLKTLETIISNQIGSPNQFKFSINNQYVKTFDKILEENRGKLILIDFWASWCIPCRREIPILEKVKDKYASKEIVFISLSLDDDNKVNDWINAMKQEGIYNTKHQYRLINAKKTGINQVFSLKTIPKYVILDRQGNILNKDFAKPSEEGFEKNLNEYLKLY